MECPACGGDCVQSAPEILRDLPTRFLPCGDCSIRIRDKRSPPSPPEYPGPCSCGKRFIDDVFVHMYAIMQEEGDLGPGDPLLAVGSPLIHPGMVMDMPPFLPGKSMVLLSAKAEKKAARRIVAEVPEIRGVVRTGPYIPGIASLDLDQPPRVYTLLAGCDVRADIYPLPTGPLVIYKQQTLIHVEFPRAGYPKLQAVASRVGKPPIPFFVDACSGPGTLGLSAACLGVRRVVLNDAWYASAFWSGFNLKVNHIYLDSDEITLLRGLDEMSHIPVAREPVKVAETTGRQVIEVYQGDLHMLDKVIPAGSRPVAALDVFDKENTREIAGLIEMWRLKTGGEAFIP